MALDFDELLKSFGEDAPSGEDLEYDPDFIDLELAAMPKEEHQVGDSVIAGEEPDYKEVIAAAKKVLARSKDMRAAVYYANAALRVEGLKGLEDSLVYIRRCCEEYWESCHPQLDPDDDDDPTMRMNAIAGLADNDTVLRGLRLAPMTESRGFGRFSLRDIQLARGEVPPGKDDDVPDPGAISAAFQDTPAEFLRGLDKSITSCRETLKALERVLDDKVGPMGPDLSTLSRTLYDMQHAFEHFAAELIAPEEGEEETAEGGEAPEEGAEGAEEGAAPAAARGPAQAKGVGSISSRKDVTQALDKIIEYYGRNEPTSPLPLLLERAKRLVNADFVTIMKDLAPEGLEKFNMIAGREGGDEGY